ncbi:hypothetical protein [Desertivirga xinjiangensis]|uniref:hypothetical protein n=1 Tax=Desertivirga xinjiangensis TaxID=539206 RepID=UPI00210C5800|nr:hypothetical protein [Pedobacter xinjiangensis]
MKQLFFISHDTQTAVKAGMAVSGIPQIDQNQVTALNAFLTLNHLKNIIPVWDDDDQFEEVLDTYTFITTEDAEKSIYSKDNLT